VSDSKRIQPAATFSQIIGAITPRLARNERVRRRLPGNGRLKIDRQLPFLCIYREPCHGDLGTRDLGTRDPGTRELVTSEAAYLFVSGADDLHPGVQALCDSIAATMEEHFGVFLFIEICADDTFEPSSLAPTCPAFEIIAPDLASMPTTIDALQKSLQKIRIHGMRAEVRLKADPDFTPTSLRPLKLTQPPEAVGRFYVGLRVRPIFRDADSGVVFPLVLQTMRNQLAKALRRGIAEFTGTDAAIRSLHHETLGPTALVKAARLVDQQLCEIAESFDFLLQVTPVNSDPAWTEFEAGRFKTAPRLHYRPLPYRPSELKRRLFNIEVERIEDTTLAMLFWEKQNEIDRQLTALHDLGTKDFILSSQKLYGTPEPDLLQLAAELLEGIENCPGDHSNNPMVGIHEIVLRSREEIDFYHNRLNSFNATVELRDDIASGIMVSHHRLLLSNTLEMRADRLEPLLHHEIGTHLLTYFNGRCQPFRQLYAGLAGYEELQEGLAVLAEYLTGGLTHSRIRGLAARVLTVASLLQGASFIETFQRLIEECQLVPRQAFVTTLRAYRGGGFTKDIIYLRGLRDLLAFLKRGHDLEPLYVGKIGLHQLPFVQELRRRGIINAPALLPRFWDDPECRQKLENSRGMTVTELLESQL
jgi:uncharacterized protein (TIGR02421 family)